MKPCPLTGAGHYWRLSYHEKYISRAECECGAVRFMADVFAQDKELRDLLDARLKKLNKTEGKEATMTLTNKPSDNGSDISTDNKVPAMAAVPPKPETAGLNMMQRNKLMHKYYEDNAAAILQDRGATGDRETIQRWGFSECGYKNFLKRRNLTIERSGKSKRREKKASAPFKLETPEPAPDKPVPAVKPDGKEPVAVKSDRGGQVVPAGFQITIIQLPPSSSLPELPAFDTAWPEMVQLRWLDTYREIARR